MLRQFAVLGLMILGTGAQALSCLPHDVAAVYKDAEQSDDRFMVVLGEMTFDETRLPKTDLANQTNTPPDTYIPAHLKGEALARAGFIVPFDQDITLNAQCFGPWCAGADSGLRYLAFVNLDRDTPEVTVTPCGGFAFGAPSPATVDQVVQCHNGGDCQPRLQR